MGKRNTFEGYLRSHGGRPRNVVAAAVVPVVLAISVADASQAAGTGTGKFLPKGAVVLGMDVVTGVTGGTAPTINVGYELSTPDDDGLALNVPVTASAKVDVEQNAGALLGTILAETAEITVGAGTGTAGTGGVEIFVTYTFDDDGVVND